MSKHEVVSIKNQALDSRVGRLEGVVHTLSEDVKQIAISVRGMTDSFGNFKEDILSKLGIATAPKWPLIASLTTLVLTIFGLCATVLAILLSGQSNAINQNRIHLAQANERFIQMAFDAGEMSAWKNTVAQKIDAIDKKLENEISATENHLQIQINELSNMLNDVRTWRLTHQENNSYLFGRLDALVDANIQDYKTFRSTTSENRWTRDDQRHFEQMLTERIKELENIYERKSTTQSK